MRMTVRTKLKAFTAALFLASATLPALAASDSARDVDRMRAQVAAAAEKALVQQGGSRVVLKVETGVGHDHGAVPGHFSPSPERYS